MASSPITSWQIDGETMETVTDFIFWAPKSLQMVTAARKLKDACLSPHTANFVFANLIEAFDIHKANVIIGIHVLKKR